MLEPRYSPGVTPLGQRQSAPWRSSGSLPAAGGSTAKNLGTNLREWNKTCREGWGYKNETTFQQVFERFTDNVVYRAYHWPNYKPPDPTPYQAYHVDWVRGRTDES